MQTQIVKSKPLVWTPESIIKYYSNFLDDKITTIHTIIRSIQSEIFVQIKPELFANRFNGKKIKSQTKKLSKSIEKLYQKANAVLKTLDPSSNEADRITKIANRAFDQLQLIRYVEKTIQTMERKFFFLPIVAAAAVTAGTITLGVAEIAAVAKLAAAAKLAAYKIGVIALGSFSLFPIACGLRGGFWSINASNQRLFYISHVNQLKQALKLAFNKVSNPDQVFTEPQTITATSFRKTQELFFKKGLISLDKKILSLFQSIERKMEGDNNVDVNDLKMQSKNLGDSVRNLHQIATQVLATLDSASEEGKVFMEITTLISKRLTWMNIADEVISNTKGISNGIRVAILTSSLISPLVIMMNSSLNPLILPIAGVVPTMAIESVLWHGLLSRYSQCCVTQIKLDIELSHKFATISSSSH